MSVPRHSSACLAPPSGVDNGQMRAAIGHFATGVTVVTSTSPDCLPVGSTANAVSSVSLDPPLVLVCLRNRSETLAALLGSGHFAVNVLHEDQLEHALGFAKPHSAELWRRVDHRRSSLDLPLLSGAVATLQCRLHDLADGGDHKIVIGHVLAVEHPQTHVDPLLFYRGGFASLGRLRQRATGAADAPEAIGRQAPGVFLPTPEGDLRLLPVDHGQGSSLTSVIAVIGEPRQTAGTLVYLHAGCLFGDALGHLHCRRRAALVKAMARIRAAGAGVLVYHRDDSSPFTGCCAQSEPTPAAAVAASEEALWGLRRSLQRLQLGDVRLLRSDDGEDALDPVALGLQVAAVDLLESPLKLDAA